MLLASIAMTTLLAAGSALTQAQTQPTVDEASDDYIVVLNDNVDNPSQVAGGMEQQQSVDVGFVYSHALDGFSAEIPDENLGAVRADPQVDYVEPDVTAYAAEQTLPWGIDRIDADLSSTMAGDGTGQVDNVNGYIIDTGIGASHPDLNVINHVNFRGDGQNTDCNGHGTHVAGTVAARDNDQDVVGVAPGAPLTGVKVLGCGGGGPISGVIKGVDWVTANAAKPAIANMSLDGPASQTLDDAVRKSAQSGIFYSIAAGNDGQPACNYSPARAGLAQEDTNGDGLINFEDSNGIVTTAATDKSDNVPDWSNYGRCVDIWAPGVSILSTKLGGGTTTMSGTSMAAPHVGGGGALYLSASTSSTPKDVEQVLKDDAQTPGTLSNAPSGTRYITLEYVGDTTKPLVSCATADGEWHKDDVSISCTASDAGSGLADPADASFSLSTSVAEGTETDNAQTNTKEVLDKAGNSVTAGPIGANKVDKKAPDITISTPQNNASYLLGQDVAADYSCIDGGSDVASCSGPVASGDNLDTASIGPKTFTVEAIDKVGNATSTSYTYTVVYDFGGFLQPVDNLPTLNVINAGRAVPVKFGLRGFQGLDIFAEDYPNSQQVACDSTAPVDGIEATATANTSGLTYDEGTDQYNYVLKTEKAWVGTCRQLVMKLEDGSYHRITFALK
jgi:subtilisin family serine protease